MILKELFGKLGKKKRLFLLETFTPDTLLKIGEDDLKIILKEAGEGKPKDGNRKIRLPQSDATGNSWNAWVTGIWKGGREGKVWVEVYHQLDHTDRTLSVPINEFTAHGDWTGISQEMDREGRTHQRYCKFTESQKAEVIREILRFWIVNRRP